MATVLGWAIWTLMTGSLGWQELLAGLLVAALVSFLAAPQLALLDGLIVRWSLPWHALRYLAVFLAALLRSNLDMARRVLSPALPIRPEIVRVPTRMRSDFGRLLLANSITLTPGTLTVDLEDDMLEVHWIDVGEESDREQRTQAIARYFEDYLLEFVE